MANAYFTTSSGSSVAGLDLNDDGIADTVQSNAVDENGTVTVIYGSTEGFDATIDLENIDPLAGFTLTGDAAGDEFGYVLAGANDLQSDGKDALLIGARTTGEVHVVFAGDTTPTFTVTGLPTLAEGMSLTALDDFNGDGIGDFAIGAPQASVDGGQTFSGAVYVIYGSADLSGTTLDVADLDGINGFVIDGFFQDDAGGTAIAGAGDLDGDGLADLVIGAPGANDAVNTDAGAAFVVYGSGTAAASEDISQSANLDVTNFFGFASGDATGSAVSAGADVNKDGQNDIIFSAPLAVPNGASSGIAYVVFDPDPSASPIYVNTLDGSNGFVIEGLSAGDRLGADVQMLGDVSGDRVGDIGVLTQTGDLYIIYGTDQNTGGSVDLSLLGQQDGPEGIVFTNLFDGDGNTQVTLTNLGDINADQSGSINDIGIAATGLGDTPLASINILGGTANFAAMQVAAGSSGGTVNFGAISGDVEFVGTDVTITITGATATMTEDDTETTGTLVVNNTGTDPTPVFSNDSASGALGMFVIVNGLWTYTLNEDSITELEALDAGDTVRDRATLTADDGTTSQEVRVTIQGRDDIAFLPEADREITVAANIGQTIAGITLTDVDADDDPTLAGAMTQGEFGKITVADDGTFSYVITNPDVTALTGDATLTDTITLEASDGSEHKVTVTLTSPIDLDVDDNPNTIITSFADDIINALGGDDEINAGAGNDTVDAGPGSDTVRDALGDDIVNGGSGNDAITLLSGNNTVNGGDDNDYIVTGFQNDIIDGGAGNDVIKAEGDGSFLFGNNTITGGTGNDKMMGGAGIDTFVFNPNDGEDEIGEIISVTDTGSGFDAIVNGRSFQAGIDFIQLTGFSLATQDAVTAALQGTVNTTLRADEISTVFDAEGTQITLFGVGLSTLEEGDFIFV